jgi:hypothetical protein
MLFHEQLLSIVSQVTGVSQSDILSSARYRQICIAKQLYAHFLRNRFKLKLKDISGIMKCHYATVLHSTNLIENLIWANDKLIIGYINEIDTCLRNLDGLNFVRKIKVNVPIDCDMEGLKLALIEKFGCSIEFVYE